MAAISRVRVHATDKNLEKYNIPLPQSAHNKIVDHIATEYGQLDFVVEGYAS